MTRPSDEGRCDICGEPMPPGEDMFRIHGYSGPCPKPPLPQPSTTCAWGEDGEDGPWATSCGHYFSIIEGTPKDNGFKFCVFCGKTMEQLEGDDDSE